jgi:hypothetical protein
MEVFRAIRVLLRLAIWGRGFAEIVAIRIWVSLSKVALLNSHTDLVRVGRWGKVRNVPWLPAVT